MKSLSNKPLAYQKGWVEFYKLKFKVTPDVLIPRPETELLVDEVLSSLSPQSTNNTQQITILDLGTGSGNIAISLAKNLSHTRGVTIIATDISPQALKIAKLNAKLHGVEDRIKFIQSNLLYGLNYTLYPKPSTLIIVANLPYIPSSRIPKLDSSVKDFEPILALDGGKDGFDLYRKLFQQIIKLSSPHRVCMGKPTLTLIVCEIDDTQGEIAQKEAQKYFPKAKIEVKKDLSGRLRVLTIFPRDRLLLIKGTL